LNLMRDGAVQVVIVDAHFIDSHDDRGCMARKQLNNVPASLAAPVFQHKKQCHPQFL